MPHASTVLHYLTAGRSPWTFESLGMTTRHPDAQQGISCTVVWKAPILQSILVVGTSARVCPAFRLAKRIDEAVFSTSFGHDKL
jgi:hypothetical protein